DYHCQSYDSSQSAHVF
nr:immunoglobulin light chain junction region [Macaca mulatta]MOW68163.1 immunoglobulin light chain junction region [Macaca mulatta]MOW68281.1 immunoglobulin light chain junction region [Macaca mulatta]MOW68378.1 immunoglobulin light chain junction region [Macaca mulatta]MOW69708.1 immunoglobulin light chain junction region [Macaca mulatta]